MGNNLLKYFPFSPNPPNFGRNQNKGIEGSGNSFHSLHLHSIPLKNLNKQLIYNPFSSFPFHIFLSILLIQMNCKFILSKIERKRERND
ncbi:hypothetical protein LguiA_013992 [Lonicera macranthoides]